MNLSAFSIRNPVFAWMLMIGLIFFGALSFKRMGVSQLPDVDFPVVTVSLSYEGAAPEVMETDVVDVVEDAVMAVQGIRSVTSTSKYGSANVSIEFELNREIDVVMQEVQTKLVQAQRSLPKELDPPVISKTNPEDQPILWLAYTSTKHSQLEMMRFVRDQLKAKLTTVSGVGEVMLGGYIEPNLRIWVANDKLKHYELTVGDILATVASEHVELPAGQIDTPKTQFDVRAMGEAKTVAEFENLLVSQRGGRPNFNKLRMKSVCRVEEGLDEIRRLSRFVGVPAIGIGIKKQRGSNAVMVAKEVKKRMAEIQKTLPEGAQLQLNFDTTEFIEQSVEALNLALGMAALLTAFVCWLFLGSWSSTFNVLMSIPTSIVGAFILLNIFGFTLNTFTLLGLSLAVGIVVDDAIMVLENIVRHREHGSSRMKASLDGSKEISSAAVAATIAIVAIFVPVVFMRGVIGKFFYQFGITMTVTVLLSLVEALTLTPMRCSKFVEAAHRTSWLGRFVENSFKKSESLYAKTLVWVLNHRLTVVAIALIFFAGSLATLPKINKEFVPAQDQGRFLVRIQTQVGSSLSFTDTKAKQIEEVLAKRPEVDRYYTALGGFGGGGGDANTAMFFVSMKDKGHRGIDAKLKHEPSQVEFMDSLRLELKAVKETKVVLQDLSMRGFTSSRGFPVEFSIRGADWEKLSSLSAEMSKKLEATGLMTEIDTDFKLGKPEIWVIPNRERAAEMGVSVLQISQTIQTMIGGVRVGKYAMGGHRYDIRVKLENEVTDQMSMIKSLFVRNNRGELVRLSDVVTIEQKKSLQQIIRYDRERAVTVFANMKAGKSQAEALAQVEKIGKETLPEGYRVVMSGSAQTFKESFSDLGFALIIGIVVAYMVLASQFNSFLDPVTVLLALPFSLSGAFIALLITSVSLNIYSFIGLILLMGIVKKNSILLVEFTNQVRRRGNLTVKQALIEACPVRLRPILMTSIATVAAAIPEAVSLGAGQETRIPMAVTVIGGVCVSTFLTLLVIPAVYSLLSRFRRFEVHELEAPVSKPGAELVAEVVLIVVGLGLAGLTGVAGFSVVGASSAQAQTMELHDVVKLSVSSSKDLRLLVERQSEIDTIRDQAKAVLYPKLTGGLTATHRKEAANSASALFGGDPYNRYVLSVNGEQPLYRKGSLTALQISDSDREKINYDIAVQKRNLALSSIEHFYAILLGQRRIEVLLEQEKVLKESLTTAERRASIGRAQKLDVLQVKTQIALLAPKLEKAKGDLTTAVGVLAYDLGLANELKLEVAGSLTPLPDREINSLLEVKNQSLPELKQFEELERGIDLRETSLMGKHWPELKATGLWGKNSFTKADLFKDYTTQWEVALNLSVPIFTGLSSKYEADSYSSQRRQLDLNRAKILDQLSLAEIKQRQMLEVLRGTLREAEAALVIARETLSEAKKSYNLSIIDYLQYLSIQQSYWDALWSVEQNRGDLLVCLSKVVAAMGVDLDLFVKKVSPTS